MTALLAGALWSQDSTEVWRYKVDDLLLRASSRAERPVLPVLSGTGEIGRWRKVIVRLDSGSEFSAPDGLRTLLQRGDLATALLDLDRLPLVASDPRVRSISSDRRARPVDDPGVLSVRARRTVTRLGLTGKGTIIGILDSGIDWKHRDFRNPDGTTRIRAILDLSESSDILPNGQFRWPGPYGGILTTSAEINDLLARGGDIRHRDYLGHGTHVAGVAAASPADMGDTLNIYGGVAPGAQIVAIKVSSTPRDSFFSEVNIVNGLIFLDSLGWFDDLPYVCNMSFGSSLGPHDGRSSYESFFSAVFSQTRLGPAGRAGVAAAGNNRTNREHASGSFPSTPGDSLVLQLVIDGLGSKNDGLRTEIWLSENHPGLQFNLVSPAGNIFGPFQDGYKDQAEKVTQEGLIWVANAYGGPVQSIGSRLIVIEFYDLPAGSIDTLTTDISIARGTWKIVMRTNTGSFDAYLAADEGLAARFGTYVSELGTVTVPGTVPDLITVGAFTARVDWRFAGGNDKWASNYLGAAQPGQLAYFSGLGPNRQGVVKPEVTGPGRWVMSSLSAWAWPDEPLSIFSSPFGGAPLLLVAPDSIRAVSQGTSFSAPHVAGICALLFEAGHSLRNYQIKDLLTSTATEDTLTGSVPNNYWGYGRANAVGAARKFLGLDSDTISITARLSPSDTLRSDSLLYEISADFRNSAHLLRSFRATVAWPPNRLALAANQPSQTSGLALALDSSALGSGALTISGVSDGSLDTAGTLLRLVLRPFSLDPADSVPVTLALESLLGDLPPLELSSLASLAQASPVSLRTSSLCSAPGDLDSSGKVDIFDLLVLLKILSGKSPSTLCSDLNRNGRTDIFDLIHFLKLLKK